MVVRIQSALVASGALQVSLDFPYPALANNSWVGDFLSQREHEHDDDDAQRGVACGFCADTLDTTNYDVSLAWSSGGQNCGGGEQCAEPVFVVGAGKRLRLNSSVCIRTHRFPARLRQLSSVLCVHDQPLDEFLEHRRCD